MGTMVMTKERTNVSECEIFDIMKKVGIPASLKGYKYLKTGIILGFENPDLLDAIVKDFYPAIGDLHNTTGTRVERAIRHAIEVSFDYAGIEAVDEIFGSAWSCSKGKPTNKEYICMMIEYLKVNGDKNE